LVWLGERHERFDLPVMVTGGSVRQSKKRKVSIMAFQRTSFRFVRLADAAFDDFAANVVASLGASTAFPNLPVPLSVLASLRVAFHNAVVAAAGGGTELIAQKNQARAALELALRQNAAYVESVAGENLAVLLSSGFKAVSQNRTSSPLSTPVVLNIDNQFSTQLMLDLKGVTNARTYQSRVLTAQGTVLTTVETTRAKRILIPNLTPGTVYTVQARAIGGSTGYSDWSDPTLKMCT
jgi:hypothetical protein